MVSKRYKQTGISLVVGLILGSLVIGCGSSTERNNEIVAGSKEKSTMAISGKVACDGSSTVYPIMEKVTEQFLNVHPEVKVTVSTSGTGGGFKKFVNGEIDIANASRPIESKEEELAKSKGVEFIELPIAFDGLTVVINPKNTWAETLTIEELKKIWEPDSKVKKWSDVRTGFPDKEIKLYGAGTDSGTFDYFTKDIVGKEKSSRSDYMASEDDNVLVRGVSGDQYALGYFGYSYYELNTDKLKAVKIDSGKGPIAPSQDTIATGTYQPLSRPLFIYVNKKALDRKEVEEFVKFVLANVKTNVTKVGYVPLPDKAYELATGRLQGRKIGSSFKGAEVGVKIEDILSRESAN